ncbi:uncharacterized protein LOC124806636 [Hydra vulgaris]|uniref:uncharacterized protein LOC124806636 n=1 Tax=Hydra vulgaris TaxID=6087 RepID=UPI001F5EC801|nr:uncharacterized protein LOC124806636 [Hydra vulgaris]
MASNNEFLTQESADLLIDIQDEGLLDEEFIIANIVDVGEESTPGSFKCDDCGNICKSKGGLTRHRNCKHLQLKETFDTSRNTMSSIILSDLVLESQKNLSEDNCYNLTRRECFKCYNFILTEALYADVKKIYDILINTNNAESYYSSFYNKIVINADVYFPELGKPNSTLLATQLADKVLAYFKRMPNKEAKQIKNITNDEIGALQYLAGYVVRKFIKKSKNSLNYKSNENQNIIKILNNAISKNSTDQELIEAQNRGGLTAVNNECQQIFVKAEIQFRNETNINHLQEIDINRMTMELLKDTEVVSFYNSILTGCGVDIDNDVSKNLLENMVKLYFRVRAFSLAKDITTKYKLKLKQKNNKGGLRKTLKKQSKE